MKQKMEMNKGMSHIFLRGKSAIVSLILVICSKLSI